MSEKRTCQEAKSLRWLANMLPEIKNPKNDEERLCNYIHTYCTVGANRIEELLARVGSKENNNDTELDGTSDRMERMKEAAQEMYNFVKIVYELLTEDDESGEKTMNWHVTADAARQLLNRIDGKENNIRKVLDYIDSEENGHEKKHD